MKPLNSIGRLIKGIEYQALHGAEAVIEWIRAPQLITSLTLEDARCGKLDDIVVTYADKRIVCRQVKCSTKPAEEAEPLGWDMLLEPQGASVPWLRQWASSLERMAVKDCRIAGELVTNRPFADDLKGALLGTQIRWDAIRDPEVEAALSKCLGGDDKAKWFLQRFHVRAAQFSPDEMAEHVLVLFERVGGDPSHFHRFMKWVVDCISVRDENASQDRHTVSLADARRAAGIRAPTPRTTIADRPLTRPLGAEAPCADTGSKPHWRSYDIARDVERHIVALLSGGRPRWIAVTGHSGVGKSMLLRRLHSTLGTEAAIVVSCTDLVSARLHPSVAGGDDTDDNLAANVDYLIDELRALPNGTAPRAILLDTMDAVLNNVADPEPLASLVDHILARDDIVLISTCRPAEFDRFRRDRCWTDNEVVQVEIADFSGEELDHAIDRYVDAYYAALVEDHRGGVKEVLRHLARQDRGMHGILAHPLTLRLLFEVHPDARFPPGLTSFELFQIYWHQKVRSPRFQHAPADLCEGLVRFLAAMMMDTRETTQSMRRLRQRLTPPVDNRSLDAGITALRSERILGRPEQEGQFAGLLPQSGDGDALIFFHDSFFEYASAKAVVAAGPQAVAKLISHVEQHADFGAMAILQFVALEAMAESDDIITFLFDGGPLVGRVAVHTYVHMADFRSWPLRKLFADRLMAKGVARENKLLWYFLDTCHHMPPASHLHLLDTQEGLLAALLRQAGDSGPMQKVMEAVARIAEFPSAHLEAWLKWVVLEWEAAAPIPHPGHWQKPLAAALSAFAVWSPSAAEEILWEAIRRYHGPEIRRTLVEEWLKIPLALRRHRHDDLVDYVRRPREAIRGDLARLFAQAMAELSPDRSADAEALFAAISRGGETIAPSTLQIFARTVPKEARSQWLDRIVEIENDDPVFAALRDFCCDDWLREGDAAVARQLADRLDRVIAANANRPEYWAIQHLTAKYPPEAMLALPIPAAVTKVLDGPTSAGSMVRVLRLAARMAPSLSAAAMERLAVHLVGLPGAERESVIASLPRGDTLPPDIRTRVIDLAVDLSERPHILEKRGALVLLTKLGDSILSTDPRVKRIIKALADDRTDSFVDRFLWQLAEMPAVVWRDCLPSDYFIDALTCRHTAARQGSARLFSRLVEDFSPGDRVPVWLDWAKLWEALESECDHNVLRIFWHALAKAIVRRVPGAAASFRRNTVAELTMRFAAEGGRFGNLYHMWDAIRAWGGVAPREAYAVLCELLPRPLKQQDAPLIHTLVAVLRYPAAAECIDDMLGRVALGGPCEGEHAQRIIATVIAALPPGLLRRRYGSEFRARVLEGITCRTARELIDQRLPADLKGSVQFHPEMLASIRQAAIDFTAKAAMPG